MRRSVSPGCVNAPAICVGCVLNACSSYPCHSGHRPDVYRRLPGVAQLEETEYQEHELRQPCLSQDHGGRRRRNSHRPQRTDRPRLPSSEWQCQTAIPSTATGGRYPRPGSSLVLRGTYAVQCKVNREQGNIDQIEGGAKTKIPKRGHYAASFLTHIYTHNSPHIFIQMYV